MSFISPQRRLVNMDIWKYWSPEKYSSFLKGVPLSEENMEKAKALGETVFRTSRKNIRIRRNKYTS